MNIEIRRFDCLALTSTLMRANLGRSHGKSITFVAREAAEYSLVSLSAISVPIDRVWWQQAMMFWKYKKVQLYPKVVHECQSPCSVKFRSQVATFPEESVAL